MKITTLIPANCHTYRAANETDVNEAYEAAKKAQMEWWKTFNDVGRAARIFQIAYQCFFLLLLTDHVISSTDTWGVLMRKDSPLAENNTIKPQDLTGLPLLASRQTIAHNDLSGWLGKNYEDLNIVTTHL